MASPRRLVYKVHALKQMRSRKIAFSDVERVLDAGHAIERYPDDEPFPSRLLLGWVGARPIHVVVADNLPDDETIVITAYEPSAELWTDDFTRRR